MDAFREMVAADAKSKVEQIPAMVEAHMAMFRENFTMSQEEARSTLAIVRTATSFRQHEESGTARSRCSLLPLHLHATHRGYLVLAPSLKGEAPRILGRRANCDCPAVPTPTMSHSAYSHYLLQ